MLIEILWLTVIVLSTVIFRHWYLEGVVCGITNKWIRRPLVLLSLIGLTSSVVWLLLIHAGTTMTRVDGTTTITYKSAFEAPYRK